MTGHGYSTPLRPRVSFLGDGLAPMADRYGELTMPLLLFASRNDHVVEPRQSEHLAVTYGGPDNHRWLERSYHVATRDYDRHDIIAAAVEFAARVVAAPGDQVVESPRIPGLRTTRSVGGTQDNQIRERR